MILMMVSTIDYFAIMTIAKSIVTRFLITIIIMVLGPLAI